MKFDFVASQISLLPDLLHGTLEKPYEYGSTDERDFESQSVSPN
jgi:hypothetical protein